MCVVSEFEVTMGIWRFATTADDWQLFNAIPAIAPPLSPRLPAEKRVEKVRELLDTLEGTFEQRWR